MYMEEQTENKTLTNGISKLQNVIGDIEAFVFGPQVEESANPRLAGIVGLVDEVESLVERLKKVRDALQSL